MLYNIIKKNSLQGDLPGGLVVETLPSNAGGEGSIRGWGAKIPHALLPKNQNIKQKQYCNKFSKDFKTVHIKKILKNKQNKTKTEKSGSIVFCNLVNLLDN